MRSPSPRERRLGVPPGRGLTLGELGAVLLTAVVLGKTPRAVKLSPIAIAPQLASRGAARSNLGPLPLSGMGSAMEGCVRRSTESEEYEVREAWQPEAWHTRGAAP